MSMAGLPWLDYPIMLHSSRKDTCKLTPTQCEYRQGYWRYWYRADHVCGHATVYFMCAVIGCSQLETLYQPYRGDQGQERVRISHGGED